MTRPSHAEWARTLVANATTGMLATENRNDETPYGSLVECAPTQTGEPLLFISSLAEHTKNLDANGACSLLVAENLGAERPLARSRATLVGRLVDPERSRDELADHYLSVHPHADVYIDFEDFAFHLVRPERIRYIGGFGDMSWVDADAYFEADPDPIWPARDEIREHMNEDHVDALVDLAEGLGDVDDVADARLDAVDRYGLELNVDTLDDDDASLRLTFDEPLDAPDEARDAFIRLVDRARDGLSPDS